MMRDDDQDSGRNARAVARIGHGKSGGHVTKAGKSKGNQIFQDCDDGPGGGDGPYVFVEYPKHVVVDGKTHIARDEAHERELKGSQ